MFSWTKSDRLLVSAEASSTLLQEILCAALSLFDHLSERELKLKNGTHYHLSEGFIRVEKLSHPVDPYVGGVDWSEGLKAIGVPGLTFEISICNVVWSHTELEVDARATDSDLEAELRKALAAVIEPALLHHRPLY